MAGIDVSVIIVSWNTRDILRDCLESVYARTREVSFEVIVIDNASADETPAMVKRDFPRVRLIENTENRGFAAANNQGMKAAAGRYVLLLNSDTIALDGAIDKMVAFADQRPEAAVIGCRVLNRDGTLQPTCFMYPSVLNMFLFATCLNKLFPGSRFFGREQMTWWKRDDVREVDVVTGCFMLVRRTAIDHVGLMDEDFFMYGEETDWCYRFRQAGWKVMFAPHGEIIHFGGASSSQAANEMTLQLKAGVLQFICKHDTRARYIVSCMLMGAFLALRIPFWAVKAIFSRRDRRNAWSRLSTYARGLGRVVRGWKGLRGCLQSGAS
jgi:GT2 family glycosyltransferase